MRTDSTLAVIFYIRRRLNHPDDAYILARITVNKKRAKISVKRSIPVKDWDTYRCRAKPLTHSLKLLNNYLDEVYGQILDAHKQLIQDHSFITSQSVKSRYLGEDDQHKTLKELINYHNVKMLKVLSPGTMKKYYTTEKYVLRFIGETTSQPDIYLKQLNYRFIVDFEQYIRNFRPKKKRKTCTNNGTMKHLERLRKMVSLAVKLEWLEKPPFRKFKLKFDKNERSYLTERELDLLEGKNLYCKWA